MLTILKAERFAEWSLVEELPGSISGKTYFGNELIKFFAGLGVVGSALKWIPLQWYS